MCCDIFPLLSASSSVSNKRIMTAWYRAFHSCHSHKSPPSSPHTFATQPPPISTTTPTTSTTMLHAPLVSSPQPVYGARITTDVPPRDT